MFPHLIFYALLHYSAYDDAGDYEDVNHFFCFETGNGALISEFFA